MFKFWKPARNPVKWLRRRFRTRRGYLRFLIRAQYVGWGVNVVFLLLALVAAFHTTLGLSESARDVIWWIPVIGFPLNGFVLGALDKAYWRILSER
jgi:fatty acid desaturase